MRLVVTLGPLAVLALVACSRMSPTPPADLSAQVDADHRPRQPLDMTMHAPDLATVDLYPPSAPPVDGGQCLPPGATCSDDAQCCGHTGAVCASAAAACCDVYPCPGACPVGSSSQCIDCGRGVGAPYQFCYSPGG